MTHSWCRRGLGAGGDAGSLTPRCSATCCTVHRRQLWTYTLTSVNPCPKQQLKKKNSSTRCFGKVLGVISLAHVCGRDFAFRSCQVVIVLMRRGGACISMMGIMVPGHDRTGVG